MITLLQTRHDFILFFSGFLTFLFIYFSSSSVHTLFFGGGSFFLPLPPPFLGKYISKYTTVLINKFIFKVAASWAVCAASLQMFYMPTRPHVTSDSFVGREVGVDNVDYEMLAFTATPFHADTRNLSWLILRTFV